MGADLFENLVNVVKLIVVFLMMIQMVPLLVWLERRGSGFIQNRFGPNRVGPLGLTQLLADAVKFIFKEEFFPEKSVRAIYYMAPVVALLPAALALAAIPFSIPIEIAPFEISIGSWSSGQLGPYVFAVQGFEISIGILYVLAVSSLGAFSLLLAGWGSNNKFSLMGALRASAQMISYELSLGLALIGSILIWGSFSLNDISAAQQGPLSFGVWGQVITFPAIIPNWGIFYQPLGALLFFIAAFAETNRLPFDIPEAEGELVAGFHTEYGGFKMLLFFMGEYGHMIVASSIFTIFFLGGYGIPGLVPEDLRQFISSFVGSGNLTNILTALVFLASFCFKVALLLWVFVWVRWTLPRFRYDRLMDLGWKTLLPWAIANTIITATVVFIVNL